MHQHHTCSIGSSSLAFLFPQPMSKNQASGSSQYLHMSMCQVDRSLALWSYSKGSSDFQCKFSERQMAKSFREHQWKCHRRGCTTLCFLQFSGHQTVSHSPWRAVSAEQISLTSSTSTTSDVCILHSGPIVSQSLVCVFAWCNITLWKWFYKLPC